MEVFAKWKDAQLHLEKAARAFLDASISLRLSLSQYSIVPSRHSSSEDLILKIQSQMALSDSIEVQLAASRAVINSTRNMSPAFVPINVLPPELFSRIFTFAIASSSRYIGFDGTSPLLAISSVCSKWRQIATGIRPFWSYISLIAPPLTANSSSSTTEVTRLWLERSRGTPLHLSINLTYDVDQRYISQLLCVLQPHLPCLTSLAFPSVNETTLELFLTFCSRHGVPGSLRSLIILLYPYGRRQIDLSWPTTYLRGLVDLQLSKLPPSMSPDLLELSTILSRSPDLRTLRLQAMTILPGQALAVSLPELQLFDITGLDRASLPGLLNAIYPGGLELDFRFSLQQFDSDDITEVILPFCERSNIVSLYLSGMIGGADDRVISLLSRMSFLRVLVLENDHGHFCPANMLDTSSGEQTPLCPKLHTLCLKFDNGMCEISQTGVEHLLKIYTLHVIVVEGFDLASYDDDSQDSDDEALWEDMNAEFLKSLRRNVPSVIVDRGLLDGENEQVDLNIRKMIDDSKVTSISV